MILFHGVMLEKSAVWLEAKMSRVATQIDLAEATQPIDYERLDSLNEQMRHLYNKARFEDRLGEEFEEKYGKYFTTGEAIA